MDALHLAEQFRRSLTHLPVYRQMCESMCRKRFVRNQDDNLFMGVFNSFEEAAAHAPPSKPLGYDNEDSASIEYGHRVQFYDYPALFWLCRSLQRGLHHVFDLGGHTGEKYHAFNRHIAFPDNLRWTVCDLPAVTARGQALARQQGATALDFTVSPDRMDQSDLLFASGSLQYLPERLDAILARVRNKPRRIVLNITAIHPSFSYFTLNSIGTAFCAYRVQSHAELIKGLRESGYVRRDSWENVGKTLELPLYPEHSLKHYSGYCFDLA